MNNSPTTNKINILAELDEDQKSLVLEYSMVETVARRDVVYLPGDDRSNVYIVVEGSVKLARISEDGREIIIDTLEEGELFGEMAVINPGEHDTMAEMMSKGKLAVINSDSFAALMQRIPKISFLLAKVIGIRRQILESKLEDLAFRNVPSRLAKFLMEQAELYGKYHHGQINLPSHYSQQEIGSMIGSTRETTSHFLNDFRRNGIIDFNKRSINIIDPERLAELSGLN